MLMIGAYVDDGDDDDDDNDDDEEDGGDDDDDADDDDADANDEDDYDDFFLLSTPSCSPLHPTHPLSLTNHFFPYSHRVFHSHHQSQNHFFNLMIFLCILFN